MTIATRLLTASAIVASIGLAPAALADPTPTITGVLNFAGDSVNNYFDPNLSFFGVPAGYGNKTGTTVAIGSGVEFGYLAGPFNTPNLELDTADFTNTSLTIQDAVGDEGAGAFSMSFTSNIDGFFDNITWSTDTFANVSYSVSNNTLTFWADATNKTDTDEDFTFSFRGPAPAAAVPEPAAWAMMIPGFGMIGTALRRRQARKTSLSFA